MRISSFRVPLLLLALAFTIPTFAGDTGGDIVLPVVGFVEGNGVTYRTELVLTNHDDVAHNLTFSFIQDGYDSTFYQFQIAAKETKFLPSAGFATGGGMNPKIGALRIRSSSNYGGGHDEDSNLEAHAFIVAERGKFAKEGSSRQEVTAISYDEYEAEEAVFLGVRHSLGTGFYTNVGVVNMDSVPVKFFIRFQYSDPVELTVPPFSLRQMRVPGEGSGGRYVHIYPEWALTDESPAHKTAWVAYASTIDMLTGDAYSGMRVPSTTKFKFPEEPVNP